jgi:hypothetical protein
VFASLPKPKAPQLLPPPPIPVEPRALGPLPDFATARKSSPPPPMPMATRRTHSLESEPPPALARTLPPVQLPPLAPVPVRGALEELRRPLSRRTKALAAVAVAAGIAAIPFLRSGQGKVFTAAAGHWGEPLPTAITVVDGQQKCSGPRCTFELAAGVHEVVARAEGYVPQVQLVAVRSREPAAMNFRLERGGSSLKMSGHPEGSQVIVDGERIGRLPLNVDLAPGTHRVRFEADHFMAEERVVDLSLGESKRLGDVALRPVLGKATFDVRTPGVDVSLFSGSERRDHLDLSQPVELDLSRKWTLEAKRDGYHVLREPLAWDGGFEKTFVIALDKFASGPVFARRSSESSSSSSASSSSSERSTSNNPDMLRTAMQRAVDRGSPADADGAPGAPVSGDPCLVSFNSIPISNVFVDNVRLGTTPVLKASVRPGVHVVQFVQGDTKKSKSFTCKPGESKVVALSLNR